ncbi:hypothetical protein DENIS_0021 [Desulfonema ishimotonii]|uniref:Uncharacterized protein n=1 Tax=Desulfonema ishimotonii TaxID=45657 RepID=A0A401FQ43_9BACT|nr:hypothetical protein DENIS_0021 [Desulfonema ishimotonii]
MMQWARPLLFLIGFAVQFNGKKINVHEKNIPYALFFLRSYFVSKKYENVIVRRIIFYHIVNVIQKKKFDKL